MNKIINFEMPRTLRRKILAFFLIFLLFSNGCGTFKYKIRKTPKQSTKGAGRLERSLGDNAATFLYQHYSSYPDQDVQMRVRDIGYSLAQASERPNLNWRFDVISSDELLSYSAPGGYVWISNGTVEYLKEDRYIAAVLAYQTAHITAKHKYRSVRNRMIASAILTGTQIGLASMAAVQASRGKTKSALMYSGAAVGLQAAHPAIQRIFKRHSKKDQQRADQYAMRYMLRTGYNPEDYIKMLEFINNPGSFNPAHSGIMRLDTEVRIEHAKLFLEEIEGLEGLKIERPVTEQELVIELQPVEKKPAPASSKPSRKAESEYARIDADEILETEGRSGTRSYWQQVASSGLIGLFNPNKDSKKDEEAREVLEESSLETVS